MSTASIAASEAFQYIFLERPQTTLGVHPGLRLKWNKSCWPRPVVSLPREGGMTRSLIARWAVMPWIRRPAAARATTGHAAALPSPAMNEHRRGIAAGEERVDCRTDLQSRRAPRIPELVFAGESPIGSPELRRLPPRSRCHCSPKAHSAGISAGVFLNPPRPCRCSHWSRG